MRPSGQIRLMLGEAAASAGTSGATWRELAQRTCVGFDVARRTAVNMARAGELVRVGDERVPGVNRPMVRYAAAAVLEAQQSPGAQLDAVVRCWADFR